MAPNLNNPERLLLALDEGLDHEVVLVLYGRAAIALGYEGAPPETAVTQDVDAIIQLRAIEALANDETFWDSRDAVNERFKDEGLYITHLFGEEQVFLRPVHKRLARFLGQPAPLIRFHHAVSEFHSARGQFRQRLMSRRGMTPDVADHDAPIPQHHRPYHPG